jgi:hypothetical protein
MKRKLAYTVVITTLALLVAPLAVGVIVRKPTREHPPPPQIQKEPIPTVEELTAEQELALPFEQTKKAKDLLERKDKAGRRGDKAAYRQLEKEYAEAEVEHARKQAQNHK